MAQLEPSVVSACSLQDRISEIEIPTGLPMIYDISSRCLSLLEGDFSDYNFGVSGELLFTPCQVEDDYYTKDEDDDAVPSPAEVLKE